MGNRYALVCAAHEGNAGMFSVDRGARNFFESRNAEYDLFVAQKSSHRMVDYHLLSDWSELKGYTHIVYWGDFLNNPLYGYRSFPNRSKRWGLAKFKKDAISQWNRLFVPERVGSDQQLFAVGQNFQNFFGDKTQDFEQVFWRLENNFESLGVRDPHSYQNLARKLTFSAMKKVHQQIDCAFLQPVTPREEPQDDTFSYYFRRSKLEDSRQLVRRIEEETGCRGVPLKGWIPLKKGAWGESFRRLKGTIEDSRFVVSDTYHVCVNAMHSGRPIVGIGRESTEQRSTVGDFKKSTLFSMFDLSRFYFEIPNGGSEGATFSKIVDFLPRAIEEFELPGPDPYYMVKAKTKHFINDLDGLLDL